MVAPIPPRGSGPTSTPSRDGDPSADDLLTQLTESRREVKKMTLATHVARAQSELEGLMQAVRVAQASGNIQHAQALAAEAGRLGRDLAKVGANHQASGSDPETIQGALTATLRMAQQIGVVAAGGDPDQMPPDATTTDLKA